MTHLRKLLKFSFGSGDPVPSVDEIAQNMQPVDESTLRLPRSFAHTMRNILETEAQKFANKRIESDGE